MLPEIWDDPPAGSKTRDRGIVALAISTPEGDEVTSLVEGCNCVFATLDDNGNWLCALESAYRQGRINFYKPISCHLYPVRIKRYDSFTAVNYHRWGICKAAEVLGRAKGIRAYKFLEGPLRRRFGDAWYEELALTCEEYLKTYPQ